EQFGAVAAALIATVLLYALNESALLLVAIGSYLIAAFVVQTLPGARAETGEMGEPRPAGTANDRFTGVGRAIQTVIIGLFTVALVGTALRVTLIDVIVDDLSESSSLYAVLIGALMAGALFGPVQVPKLLGHFPIQIIVTGAVLSIAVAAVLAANSPSIVLIAPILLISGTVLHTLDLCSGVTLRLLSREQSHEAIDAMAGRAVIAGQLVALISILLMAMRLQSVAIMTALSLSCAILIVGCFLVTGGLPLTVREIRQVLQRFSSR
ncbi:MAG: hypothetical protein ACOC9Y_07020, partial [Chloroflexota bacterium]